MTKIKELALIKAIKQSNEMDLISAEKVVDEIYLEQPNLLGSVLVLNQMGNKLEHVEVVLNILIVAHLALKYSGVKIETVTEKLQERELARYTGHVTFTENLNSYSKSVAINQFTRDKSEKALMAYVVKTMNDAGLTKLPNESAKYLIMSGINIVNCIGVAKLA